MVNCGTCTECCKGPRKLSISADDARRMKHYRVFTQDGMKYYLARKENEDCVYLGETGCTIYEQRPDACRKYDCRDYVESGLLQNRILIQALKRL